MKKLACVLFALVLTVSNSAPAYAWDFWAAYEDDWTRSARTTKKFQEVPTKVTLEVECDIYTFTPVLLNHEVESEGVSNASYDYKIPGYTYKVASNGHEITATATGVGVDIDFKNPSSVSINNNSATKKYNSMNVSYSTEVECFSLVQYKEKHSVLIELYRPGNNKSIQEELDVVSNIRLYK